MLARPGPDEFAAFYAAYIARVPDIDDGGDRLGAQRDAVCALLGTVAEGASRFRYAPGKWSVNEVLGHLADAERVFSYRLLRLARGDETPLAGFDENAYVRAGGFDARGLEERRADWRAVREATLSLVRGLNGSAWEGRGLANGHLVSARALLYIILGHTEHHLEVLRTRYGVGLGGPATR